MEGNYFNLLASDVKRLWNGLDSTQKFAMLVIVVITLVSASFFLSKAMEPDWAVLYSDLSETNAISVVEGLKKNGHPYKLSEDKRTILVPSKIRDELRVFVVENDMIQREDSGFELLDDMQLGSTDFKNKLTKQRIYQGELTRAIEKMQGIKYAKVHLAEPERSIFQDKDEAPSASVMLVLEPGYRLKTTQVKAIKNLVAFSVPRLVPDRVFITDQNGASLSDEVAKNSTDMESFKSNLETQTAGKITKVLEKIVGPGNVSVQVNADIDFNSAKATIESYIPVGNTNQGVMTSSQTEIETYENPNQIPVQNGVTANPKNLNYSKEKSAVNYSVSKEIKQVVYAPGTIKRLTIAVAVNKILTDAEKTELQNLVLSASGGNYDRGDIITISGLQFEGLAAEEKRQSDIKARYQKEEIIETVVDSILPLVILCVLGIIALVMLKGILDKFAKVKMPTGNPTSNTVVNITPNEEAMVQLADREPIIEFRKNYTQSQKESNITELNDIVMQSPEEAAKLITSYLKE